MAPPHSADGPGTSADPLLDRLRLATRGVYEVEGELGRGGMAVVYLGVDTRLERRVAIKVMDPRLSLTQGMAERFLREARLAARLQHPNIIVVYEIRQSDDIVFFVMSLIDGVAVDELVRKHGPLPIDQVRWILQQASRALAFAHSEGVVHRDIKPANILLNFKGEVILTDFGIAKALGGEGLTQSGQSIGTPVYMSPEQFSGMEMGPATDQYSLGITAYQLLTGKPPFAGDLYQLVAAHGTVAPVPLRELRPDCPAFLANAIMRMLAKKPSDRWPSLEDLEEVFGANMASDGGAPRRKLAESAVALRRERAGSQFLSMPRTPATPSVKERPDTFVVTISPPGATIFVGGTLELRASVSLDTGQSLPGAAVTWASSEPGVLAVSATGTVSGVVPGAAVVRATVPGAWSEATIRVEAAPLARLSLSKPNLTLLVGDVMLPEVFAVDVNGVTRTDAALVWISRSPAVAELDAPGTIRAISPGLAVIDVSVGNVRRSIDVTVVRRPVASLRLRAVEQRLELGGAIVLAVDAFDDRGTAVFAPPVRWASSAPSIIHVDSAGTALAIGPGVARITAALDEATDSVELEALEAPVGSIQLSLSESEVEVGDEVSVVLRVKDPNGALRSTSGVRVWSNAPMVADFDPVTSVIRTHRAGEAHISAGSDDPRSSFEHVASLLVVRPVSIVRLEVFPDALEIELGSVAAVNVRGIDRRGRDVGQIVTTWRSDAPEIGVVEGHGTVRAMTQGATTLRVQVTNASGASIEETLILRVLKPSVARLSITAEHTMLSSGDIQLLRVSTWTASGTEVRDAAPLWRSTDPDVARVEGSGRLMALSPGRATIIAELDGKSAQVAILVAPAPIVRLSIIPARVSVVVGEKQRLECEAVDRDGNVVVPVARWSVTPADLARIDGAGELTPLRAGEGTVSVSLVTPSDQFGVLTSPTGLIATAPLDVRTPQVVAPPVVGKPPAAKQAAGKPVQDAFTAAPRTPRATVAPKRGAVIGVVALILASAVFGISRLMSDRTGGAGSANPTVEGQTVGSDAVVSPSGATAPAATTTTTTPPVPAPVPERNTAAQPGGSTPAAVPAVTTRETARQAPVDRTVQPPATKINGTVDTITGRGVPPPVSVATTTGARVTPPVQIPVPAAGTQAKPLPTVTETETPPVPSPATESPTRDDLRVVAERIADDVRTGRRRTGAALAEFFGDGAEHSVSVSGPPSVVSENGGRTRAEFTLRLARRNNVGVPERRAIAVTMDVSRRNQVATLESVSLGALTKAK